VSLGVHLKRAMTSVNTTLIQTFSYVKCERQCRHLSLRFKSHAYYIN